MKLGKIAAREAFVKPNSGCLHQDVFIVMASSKKRHSSVRNVY
jgi:hypothetical protein